MAVKPDWALVRQGLGNIDAQVARLPSGLQARADQMRAYARDFFDSCGVDVTDEDSVYVALITASLMVDFAEMAARQGRATPAHLHGVSATARTIAALLSPYVPPEAGR